MIDVIIVVEFTPKIAIHLFNFMIQQLHFVSFKQMVIILFIQIREYIKIIICSQYYMIMIEYFKDIKQKLIKSL